MSTVTIGLFVSAGISVLLLLLFRYEDRRGSRIGEGLRTVADVIVLKIENILQNIFRIVGRDLIRKTFHYMLHACFKFVLKCLRRCENGLRNIIIINRTIAKNVDRETATKNKLEQIALHKIENALTEKEKVAYKKKMLQGK